jgi:hypothetical protein
MGIEMTVKRFDFDAPDSVPVPAVESVSGEFVLYEDYAQLYETHKDLLRKLNKLQDKVKAAYLCF